MREKLQRFMTGRYGMDGYGRFLSFVAMACVLLGAFTTRLLTLVGLLLIIYCYFRIFSRNLPHRTQENYVYYGAVSQLKQWLAQGKQRWAQRRTHRVFSCPHCHQRLRVPRGRGKISITCARCHTEFIRKS
ncbi:MAG: hypothetical protein RR951_02545 [Ruthenibacterium sp.]